MGNPPGNECPRKTHLLDMGCLAGPSMSLASETHRLGQSDLRCNSMEAPFEDPLILL